MKKIFIIIGVTVIYCYNLFAQQATFGTLTLDSTKAVRVAPMLSKDGDFNVILSKEFKVSSNPIAREYSGFVDTTSDNSFKKINDSTYEIDVKNPCKGIYLVEKISSDDHNIGPLFSDFSESPLEEFMINYSNGGQSFRYSAWNYNPFFYKYSEFNGVKDVGRKFLFKYFFPKPILAISTTKDYMIKRKQQFPSANFRSFLNNKNFNETDSSFPQNNNGILFVFEHFGRQARKESNDYLKYKLDNSSDWSFTALSYSPSILLENLPSGKHTLYVSYDVEKSQDADILEYHFNIAPN